MTTLGGRERPESSDFQDFQVDQGNTDGVFLHLDEAVGYELVGNFEPGFSTVKG
jgi:hypothetical protein